MVYHLTADDMVKVLTGASLSKRYSRRSVRWLMREVQAQEIATRLRELRDNSRETNRTIADYCDVAERTVAGWASPGNPSPMTFEHAEKVADLFGVDVAWLWRGREKGMTPDIDGSFSDRLARIEADVKSLLEMLAPIAAAQAADDVIQAKPQSRSRSARARASSGTKRQVAKRRA